MQMLAEIEITWKYYFTYINELFQPALGQLFTMPSAIPHTV